MSYNSAEQHGERKEKEKTMPFGVSLMRSQVLYRAAQMHSDTRYFNVGLSPLSTEQEVCKHEEAQQQCLRSCIYTAWLQITYLA